MNLKKNMLTFSLCLALLGSVGTLFSNHCVGGHRSQEFGCAPRVTDYVIVGLGTAGSALARKLSDDFGNKVTVLEDGENYNNDPLVLQKEVFGTLAVGLSPKYSRTFSAFTGLQINRGFDGFLYTDGRMWGGSAAHNGLIVVRGSKEQYDAWAAASGNNQWAYENLLPVMLSLENYTATNSVADYTQRGDSGPIKITQEDQATVTGNSFLTTYFPMYNMPVLADYNVETSSVCVSVNQRFITSLAMDGERSFASKSFLPTPEDDPVNWVVTADGKGRGGRKLTIVSHARVTRILFANNKAIGVEYIVDGDKRARVYRIQAHKKIILCAGASQTPAILQYSGVGPQAVLDANNITPVVYSEHVGRNMQNHYGTNCVTTATPGVSLAPHPLIQGVFVQAFSDCSPYYNSAQAADSVRRNQIFFGGGPLFGSTPILRNLGYEPFVDLFATSNSYAFNIMTPKARGTVEISDPHPTSQPLVDFNFYGDYNPNTDPFSAFPGSDYDNMISVLRTIRDITHAAGEKMIYPSEEAFDDLIYNNDYTKLINHCRDVTFLAFHAASTCRMGTDISNSVVDGNLHVHGTQNLMVADCSIEPIVQTGNTCYGAYLIGLVAARICGSTTVPANPGA